jgi:nitrate ABC transporter ATP-binding subunit
MKTYLEFTGLCKDYPDPSGGITRIVDHFELNVAEGEFIALLGHSGCGKSTVLSMAAGLTEATLGGVVLAGREIDGPSPAQAVVFQAPCLYPWMTALQNVRIGVDQVFSTANHEERSDIASYYLALVGLEEHMHKRASDLSGGMRQRVGIARAFALRPKVLLLDEPFGMLDGLTRSQLQELLLEIWARDRITAIMVTHDVDEAIYLADRVVMMTQGPNAKVGEIIDVNLARPRKRSELLESPEYYALRGKVLAFLEEQEIAKESKVGV